jgi:transcriptional regulator with XRE-family HTH domain
MDLGRRIREVREDLGMPAAVLARRIGVAPNTVWRYESGEREPSMAMLEKIARELRTEPAELLREPVPLAEAPQETGPPELDVELTNLWKSLAKRAGTLKQRYRQEITYEGLIEDLARLSEDRQYLERLRKAREGAPRAYHMEPDELADAIDDVLAEENAIWAMLEQDLEAPEWAKQEARRFRQAV